MPKHECSAAVLVDYQKPLEIRSYPVPADLGPDELLVRVEMAGICGTDVHLWLGQLPIPLPVILGHESAGTVERMGSKTVVDWAGNKISEGDRITWASSIVCGHCFYCQIKAQPTRCLARKAYGISYCANDAPHLRGGYAEYIVLRKGTAAFRLPQSLPTEAIIGAGCALTTAIHGLERAPVKPGDNVVVQGAGPVGLAALALAIEAGASKTIVVGAPTHRLELAKQFGAHSVISIEEHSSPVARRELVMAETGGYGADLVVECVGYPAAFVEGLDLCRDGGTYLVLGQYANAGDVAMNPHTITRKQLNVVGSWAFEPRHVYRAISWLDHSDWKQKFARQVTHRFPLPQANEALDTVRQHRSGKAVIVP
jgi:threonine dehydrogenase-like Zn-dependent dehydrogenase